MQRVFIIAEAGVNHNGSLSVAKRLVDAAVLCRADAIKFQIFKTEEMITESASKASYQKKKTPANESQFKMLKRLELDIGDYEEINNYCKHKRIMFLASAFDLASIDLLWRLDVPIFKIPSGEITNLLLLKKIGGLKRKIILSSGASYLREVRDALDLLIKAGTSKKNITVLHCSSAYPIPLEEVNLLAMVKIQETLGVKVGYSDHTRGIEVAISAVALGAVVIEKHLTLNKEMVGPDHKASLEPEEFKMMVERIRNVEKALGNKLKKPSPSELKNRVFIRKSIVAAREIKKGELFTPDNLAIKRPAGGLSPFLWDRVIRRIAKRDFSKDEFITLS